MLMSVNGPYAMAACWDGGCCEGGGGGASNRVDSAIMREKPIPTPSITARSTAQPIALLRIALAPPRTARAPPVKNPPIIAFQGSSFFLFALSANESQLLLFYALRT
jgi:hypothetical protein